MAAPEIRRELGGSGEIQERWKQAFGPHFAGVHQLRDGKLLDGWESERIGLRFRCLHKREAQLVVPRSMPMM